jgi:GAF domain-containing protein
VETDPESIMDSADRSRTSSPTIDDMLQVIAQAAVLAIPGVDAVGISTIEADGSIRTRAVTDPLVPQLDRLQYSLRQGPCVDSLREADLVLAPHIRHDQRWPEYVGPAVELGLKAQLAVRCHLGEDGVLGSLNAYLTRQTEIPPEAERVAELFAAQAAFTISNARRLEGLTAALVSRKRIGQAVGLLMSRYTLSEDAAFALLARTSSHSNIKVRDIATTMVEEANQRALSQGGSAK